VTASREHTLGRMIGHVRNLVPAPGAVAILTADGRLDAAWYARDDLRAALGPALQRSRPGAVEVDGASIVASEIRNDQGARAGMIVAASLDPDGPLGADAVRPLEAVADLGALALGRAALLEAEARRARDDRALERAFEEVSGSLEVAEVYDRIVRHAAAVTGGTRALLSRLGVRLREVRTVARVNFSDDLSHRALTLASGSFAEVARSRAPTLRRRPEAEGAEAAMMDEVRIGSIMHVPIEIGPRFYGVLTVTHEDAARFDRHDLDLLVRLARSSAAAIANAIDFGRERRIARALTAGFVPESLPVVPGYETGLVYEPAANEAAGGDLYGVWPTRGGEEMAVLVGDVAGKGVEMAALSAMARFFIEALSHRSASPAQVLGQANRMLCARLPRDTFVTAFLAILSRDSLRYTNAGHLPPLLVSWGRASTLDSHGLPLGIDDAALYGESRLVLGSGALVFAYSDGLVETRRGTELYGAGRLSGVVERWSCALPPQELARAVRDEVADWGDGLADDALALALRRTR